MKGLPIDEPAVSVGTRGEVFNAHLNRSGLKGDHGREIDLGGHRELVGNAKG